MTEKQKAIIEKIAEYIPVRLGWDDGTALSNDIKKSFMLGAEAFDELDKWISVDESLPPDGETVLLCENGNMSIGLGAWTEDKGFHIDDIGDFYDKRFITHWQPIQPPKSVKP